MQEFIYVTKPNEGGKHSIGITASGQAYSWGKNSFGQLGRGPSPKQSAKNKAKPVELENKNDDMHERPRFVKGYVGGFSESGHSALLDSEGRVWLAGCDRWQQLGLGSSSGGSAGYTWNQGRVWRNSFVRNDFLANIAGPIRDLALGGDHTVALSSNQKDVYVFGKGGDGQLGLDGAPFVSAPTRSKLLSADDHQQDGSNDEKIAAVCAFRYCSLTLNEHGEILKKAGNCRKMAKSLQDCIERAQSDGVLSKRQGHS